MGIRRRGKRWSAEVRLRGVQKHGTFDTKAEATEWKVDVERRIKAGFGIAVAGKTLEDAFMRFIEEECPHRTKGAWEETRLLFCCRDELAKVKLDQLTPEVIDRWQKRQLDRVSSETVRRDRALLSAVMSRAVKVWRWLPASPFKDVPLPPEGQGRTRLATPAEIERLRHVAGTDLRTLQGRVVAAFEFACETGMRGGEIVALGRSHAFLGHSYVHVPTSKNGKARDVALSPRAVAILKGVLALGLNPPWGLTTSQKDAIFRKIREKAGIRGLNFHDSRHTACTALAKKLDVLELARQLGVVDLKTLMVYFNESAAERAKRL